MKNRFMVALVVLAMAGVLFAEEEKKDDRGIGVRGAFGFSGVNGGEWRELTYDYTGDYKNPDAGFTFGGGLFKIVSLDAINLNLGANFMYRNTVSVSAQGMSIDVTEMAIEVPILTRFSLTDQVYLEAGPQVNIILGDPKISVFGSGQSYEGTFEDDGLERSSPEFGITVGAGFVINEKISADVRYFYGLSDYEKKYAKGTAYTIQLGINYNL
ncbi:MAG: PorT family protein [Fibromonadaceae bacterium]|jgi:hypothetical protein|nr:PorT family protein [Fibromonadaceae bacterium]